METVRFSQTLASTVEYTRLQNPDGMLRQGPDNGGNKHLWNVCEILSEDTEMSP